MRSKEEILSELVYSPPGSDDVRVTWGAYLAQRLQLEVLLDIRALLDAAPAVKHPDSPPPPEVR